MFTKALLAIPVAAALGLLAVPSVQAHQVPVSLAGIAQNGLLVPANDEMSNDAPDEIDGQVDNSETDDTVDTTVSYDGENSGNQPVYVPPQYPINQPIFVPNGNNDVQENDNNGIQENDNTDVQENDNNVQNDESDVEQGDNNTDDNGGD